MWGADAPLTLRLIYVFWASNVILVQTRILPNFTQVVIHAVSIASAFNSGEFFHARILTACHFFMLDLIFGYSTLTNHSSKVVFGLLPEKTMGFYNSYIRSVVAWIGTVMITILIFIFYFSSI